MAERTPQWDGKCERCRRLMSRCECFQLPDDRQPAAEPAPREDPRPLYNALRKMHRKTPSFLAQPPAGADADARLRTKSHDLPPRAGRSALKAATSLPTLPRAPPRLQAPRGRPQQAPSDAARGIYTPSTPVKPSTRTKPAVEAPVELDGDVWEL